MTNTIGATPEEREMIERLRKHWLAFNESTLFEIAAGKIESLISDRAKLREVLEVIAGGSVDVSNTAIIVGNGASTVMRQVRAALATDGSEDER